MDEVYLVWRYGDGRVRLMSIHATEELAQGRVDGLTRDGDIRDGFKYYFSGERVWYG